MMPSRIHKPRIYAISKIVGRYNYVDDHKFADLRRELQCVKDDGNQRLSDISAKLLTQWQRVYPESDGWSLHRVTYQEFIDEDGDKTGQSFFAVSGMAARSVRLENKSYRFEVEETLFWSQLGDDIVGRDLQEAVWLGECRKAFQPEDGWHSHRVYKIEIDAENYELRKRRKVL